jgi:hypothetical protein
VFLSECSAKWGSGDVVKSWHLTEESHGFKLVWAFIRVKQLWQ